MLFMFCGRRVFGYKPHKIYMLMYRWRNIQIQPDIEYYTFIVYDNTVYLACSVPSMRLSFYVFVFENYEKYSCQSLVLFFFLFRIHTP